MKRIELKPGLHFWRSGREYIIKQQLADGELQITEVITEISSTIQQTAIIQLLFRGEIEFQPPDQKDKAPKKPEYLKADFSQISDPLRAEAKKRYHYVSRVLELNLPSKDNHSLSPVIQQVAQLINDSSPPTWITVYRWLKTYEKSGNDIRALVPKHQNKGNNRTKIQPEVKQIIEQAIKSVYLTPIKPDIADVYQEVLHLINKENQNRAIIGSDSLKIPHRSTIYRAVASLEPSKVAISRYGKRIASQMYDPVQRSPQPSRPLERVEIDHTKLPLFVVDADNRLPIGTPWLTSAIDKYSGIVLGYYLSFEPPSYLSVMQCLSHAITPKNYLHSQFTTIENDWLALGLPEVIVVDNGREFYSNHLEDACLQLGISLQYCPPKMPWYKSAIERYFGALNSQLLSDAPGKTFSNFLQSDDYDPKQNAVISFDGLQEMLHIFIVDIYNQSPHPELKSARSIVWATGVACFPPVLPPSHLELKVLIGHITTRKITRRGIEFEGLLYNSSELVRLRVQAEKSAKTTVKYDPKDLSRLYVFDELNHQFLEVPALNQEYTKGLSLWQHRVVKKLASQTENQVDIIALALAKEKIQKIVEREWNFSKKGKSSMAMARWLGIGRDGLNSNSNSSSLSQPVKVNDGNSAQQASNLTGISELGNALNQVQSAVDANNGLTTSVEVVSAPDATEKAKKTRKKSIQKPPQIEPKVESSSQDWQPDLSGWSVTIGLPK